MAAGFCPFAVDRNIPPRSNDPAITPRVAILHVDAGNADSLFDYFKNRSGGIESHFFVKANGIIEQYRSIYFQADANLDANDFAVSIETQGFGEGTWKDKQLAAIKRLLLWLNTEAGIPLRKIRHWDGSGVGYHTLFGAPSHWTPFVKTCPGPDRIDQFEKVLVPWMKSRQRAVEKTMLIYDNLNWGRPADVQRRRLKALKRVAEAKGIKRVAIATVEDVTGGDRERIRVRGLEVTRRSTWESAYSRMGFKIRNRKTKRANLAIPGLGIVPLFVIHMPLRSMPPLRAVYAALLRLHLRRTVRPWIVATDANERPKFDPLGLEAAFGAVPFVRRIDGFWVHPDLVKYVEKVEFSKPHRDGHVAAFMTINPEEN